MQLLLLVACGVARTKWEITLRHQKRKKKPSSLFLHSAARLKSRHPSTPAADTTTSPPPAAGGSGKKLQAHRPMTHMHHLTPPETFHTVCRSALTISSICSERKSRAETRRERKLKVSALKESAKNKRLITAPLISAGRVFFFPSFFLFEHHLYL